jgi:hypothetical protein
MIRRCTAKSNAIEQAGPLRCWVWPAAFFFQHAFSHAKPQVRPDDRSRPFARRPAAANRRAPQYPLVATGRLQRQYQSRRTSAPSPIHLANEPEEISTLTTYPDLEETALRQSTADYAGVQSHNIVVANGFIPL